MERRRDIQVAVDLHDLASRLWAHEMIKQLKAAYLHAVDCKDYDAIAALFTSDATIDFTGELRHHVGYHGVTADVLDPPPGVVEGGPAAAQVIKGAIDGIVTVHHGHDPAIEVTSPTTAKGRWSLYDILDYGDETMHGYGHYLEEYRLDHGHWRFSSLVLTRLRVTWEVHRRAGHPDNAGIR